MPHGLVSDAVKERWNDSRTHEVRVQSFRWKDTGAIVPLGLILPGGKKVFDIPIEDGSVTVDGTDSIRRRGSLVVVGEEWIPGEQRDEFGTIISPVEDHPLSPFGQWLQVEVRSDMPDGSWSPWLRVGTLCIISVTVDRPSGTCKVELAGRESRLDEYGFTDPASFTGQTAMSVIDYCARAALPNAVFVTKPCTSSTVLIDELSLTITAGVSRLDLMHAVGDQYVLTPYFDHLGDLVIRNALTDVDGYATGVTDVDLGTTANPVGFLVEGPGGNIKELTASVSRQGAANGIVMTVKPGSAPKGAKPKDPKYLTTTMREMWTEGPAAWSDEYGRLTVQRDFPVKAVTQDSKAKARIAARRLLATRKGVIRRLEVTALALWHLDYEDLIVVTWRQRMPDGTERVRSENHRVESIDFDLRTSEMRLTCREEATTVLLEPWDPEPTDTPPPPPAEPGDPYTPPPAVPPFKPVPPTYTASLAGYRAELKANPSAYATHREYAKVTAVVDGDTFTCDFYSDPACTIRTTALHANGKKYSSGRIRMGHIQAPESSWFGGPSAKTHLQALLPVGAKVRLRADTNADGSTTSYVRYWREVFRREADGTYTNVCLEMLDDGYAYPYPFAKEPRNALNRVIHGQIAAITGKGLYASRSAFANSFTMTALCDPAGADTGVKEWAELKNISATAIDVGGWRFGDPSPLTSILLPVGTIIQPGAALRVVVGKGTNGTPPRTVYMQHPTALFNNAVETLLLYDNSQAGAGKLAAMGRVMGGNRTSVTPLAVLSATGLRVTDSDVTWESLASETPPPDNPEPRDVAWPGAGG